MHWLELGVVVLAIWLARAIFTPYAKCRRCSGRKVNALTRIIGGERYGPCGSCDGSGQRMVLSAKFVRHAVRGMRSVNSKKKG